jgi:sigma-B regulation protein RsbQ
MQCAQDNIAPETVGRWLADQLPQSTFHVLEATGHCPHLTHPEETIRVIRRYLASPAGLPSLTDTM